MARSSPDGAVAPRTESQRTRGFSTLLLNGVGRSFGGTAALAGLDLEIRQGEFIALLGPSGCGKSTALNCLAGLLPLTSGSIWQDDTRVDVLPPEQRGFGMVFQHYALFPHMSVHRNVAFGLQMRRLDKAEVARRADEAIRLVRLEEHAHKLPGQLSGGQQQRVAIARAIVLEPSLVLMDEPLSNLDAKLRLEMRTEIRRLHQSLGLTTVYVTHDQEEALSMADRLLVLRDGEVQQIGSPEDLHNRPANWHVADFMGYRNLLRLTAGSRTGGGLRVTGDGLELVATEVGDIAAGSPVVVGARPEDLTVSADAGNGPNRIRAAVDVVQYQGRELAVEAHTESGVVLHVATEHRVAPGEEITIEIAVERLLAFTADGVSTQVGLKTSAGESSAVPAGEPV